MATNSSGLSFLTQSEAVAVDNILMGEAQGFAIEQLMELAGLSCASAVSEVVFKTFITALFLFLRERASKSY